MRPLCSDGHLDEVARFIEQRADDVFTLPAALNAAAEIMRLQRLDVLVFPEVSVAL